LCWFLWFLEWPCDRSFPFLLLFLSLSLSPHALLRSSFSLLSPSPSPFLFLLFDLLPNPTLICESPFSSLFLIGTLISFCSVDSAQMAPKEIFPPSGNSTSELVQPLDAQDLSFRFLKDSVATEGSSLFSFFFPFILDKFPLIFSHILSFSHSLSLFS